MLKSTLSLYIELDRLEKRKVIPYSYANGTLVTRVPTKLGKDTELYIAIAYIGRQVFSSCVINKELERELCVPIGEVVRVQFDRIDNERNMLLSIKIKPSLIEAFNDFAR